MVWLSGVCTTRIWTITWWSSRTGFTRQGSISLFLIIGMMDQIRKFLSKFTFLVKNQIKLRLSGRRLYQYNEGDFFSKVLIVKKISSNYKFIIKQREADIWFFDYFSQARKSKLLMNLLIKFKSFCLPWMDSQRYP